MRSAVLALAAFAPTLFYVRVPRHPEPPRVAWTTPDANYPLKVRVLSSARQNENHHDGITDTQSYGAGNLLSEPMVGFDYKSDCVGGFMHNASKGEYYQGRWKKQDRKIEILTMQTGSTHPEHCDIDVTLKSAPYGKDNPPPQLVTARN